MATVHFGRLVGQVGFSRTVAIKCLHPQYSKDPEFISMFLDEARLAARIRHPNVVPILDVVALDGELFMVMEYVQGESFSRLLRAVRNKGQRVPMRIISAIMIGVLDGLHAAHEAVSERGEPLGIVHRDVSPQNVMIGLDGVARVLDFGVAKAAGRIQSTRDGQLKGKIAYMAPEQLRGSIVDRRTDVYAASVVLWEALAGRRLFDAEDEVVMFGKVLNGIIDPPGSVSPGVPKALDELTMRGLSADPTLRFQTAQEMAIGLERAIGMATPREVGRWVDQWGAATLRQRAERIAEIESTSSSVFVGPEGPRRRSPSAETVIAHPTPSGRPKTPPPQRSSDRVAAVDEAPTQISEPSRTSKVRPNIGAENSRSFGLTTDQPQALPLLARKSRNMLPLAGLGAVLLIGSAVGTVVLVTRSRASQSAQPVQDPTTALQTADVPSAPASSPPPIAISTPPGAAESQAIPPVTALPVATTPKAPRGWGRPPVAAVPPAGKGPATPPPPAPPPPNSDCSPPYTLDSKGVRIPKPQCL
jgi:eukaryotic-like serine/threonine-protein kinase